MYALCPSSAADLIAGEPDVTILHRYPETLLVRAAARPAGIPESGWRRTDTAPIHVHGRAVALPAETFVDHRAPHTLIRLAGPIAPQWRERLAEEGIALRFWCPAYGACVSLPPGLRPAGLGALFPWVLAARPYTRELCRRRLPSLSRTDRMAAGIAGPTWDVVCFSRQQREAVEEELIERGARVLDHSSSKIRARWSGRPDVLRRVPGVKLVDLHRAPVLLDNAEELAALEAAVGLPRVPPPSVPRFTGRGQIVAVADTGLDSGTDDERLHADFRGRVAALLNRPCNAVWRDIARQTSGDGASDDNSGHGTHVAGLVLGNGTASHGRYRGLAPEARLVFQALEQRMIVKREWRSEIRNGYYLSGRPLDLRELLEEARGAGARIHVLAWGDPTQGAYSDDCYEVDFFLHRHPDAVVVCAAGNDGTDRDGDRVAEPGGLYAPAAAKNTLAVGATEGPVAGVGWRTTWGEVAEAGRFGAAADQLDPVSGEAECMALFSSAGPSADGRVKPDLCAPGTNLAAPRSQRIRVTGWGPASPAPLYMYSGGTSVSTGVAGGAVAALRQAWQEHLGVAPGGAALKALLIFAARPVERRDHDGLELPRAAGFGRLHLAAALPGEGGQVPVLVEVESGLETGERREWAVEHPGGPWRAVLAWYDAPGEVLVNDLDLYLHGATPGGESSTWWGHPPSLGTGAPDSVNTVERITVDDLPAGSYRLGVRAVNVPEGPQPFAVVYSGPPSAPRRAGTDTHTGTGTATGEDEPGTSLAPDAPHSVDAGNAERRSQSPSG